MAASGAAEAYTYVEVHLVAVSMDSGPHPSGFLNLN